LHSLGDRLPRYLVQTCISGFDIDCSVLCREGGLLAYTIQQGLVPNRIPFGAADTIQFIHDQAVLSVVEKLMGQLKWSGIAHIDLRYDNKRENLHVLEINGRYWGTLFGSLCAGVNFPYLACLAAMNKPFAMPAFRDGYFASVGAHLRHTWKNPLKLAQLHRTPLRFGLADPLPELVRITKELRGQGM
jgi:predicted ATP-grasp superfamily ATP-dependent carboligase